MNILIIGKFYKEGFGLHIAETLEAMGHKVFRYSPGLEALDSRNIVSRVFNGIRNSFYNMAVKIPTIKRYDSRKLFKILKENEIDLTIVVHDFLLPEEVAKIKIISKAPIVLWFPDANCGKWMFLNAPFDALFFKDPYIVHSLKKDLNKPVYYLPECCNPQYHKAVSVNEEDKEFYGCDITTAGNMYPNREAFFKQLGNYKVKIWGNPPPIWMDFSKIKKMMMRQPVLNKEKAKAFISAKIVLNNLLPTEIWGINCRAFEIPACGGFEIINWRPGLNQLFEDGKEIVSFKNFAELTQKISYYLSHEDERIQIIKAGQKRAHKEHTYESRLALLIDTVLGNAEGYKMPKV